MATTTARTRAAAKPAAKATAKPAAKAATKPAAKTAAKPAAEAAPTTEEKSVSERAAKAQATRAESANSTETRTCAGECGETKPINKFPTTSANKDGEMGRGKVCRACRDKARAEAKAAKK